MRLMKLLSSVLTAGLLAGVSLAQNPTQPNGGTTIRLAPGTVIRVELAKTVDAKRAKVGFSAPAPLSWDAARSGPQR